MRSKFALLTAVALTMLVLVSCATRSSNAFNASFYDTPSAIPADVPGTIIRFETMNAPFPESQAWRVLYTSTGINGEPIVVSGMVFAPTGPVPPGGRPVVSWAHPTTGIEDPCAPSRSPKPYDDVQGLADFLNLGWVVVATDYQGLGTDGMHPYLVGASEAQGTIDIVRAARNMNETGASSNYFVFGHSQGGQAALFAGQMAASYAPELQLLGVAAAAPAGLLVPLFQADKDTVAGSVLGSYAVVSWSDIFGYDEATVVKPSLNERVHAVSEKCVIGGSRLSDIELGIDDLILKGRMWSADPATTAPWSNQFALNTAAQSPITVPLLLTQGTADKIITPSTTTELTAMYVAMGNTQATEQVMDGVDHMKAGKASVPYVVPFFQRLAK
jgi:alpha-beta hydrolase superfamily lysophospholipase